MILDKKEIQKIAAEIRRKLSVAPTVTIRGDMNRAVMGGAGGGANISLTPSVANPMGLQTDSTPKTDLPAGVSNEKSPSKT